MGFALDPEQPIDAALHEAARDELERALERLQDAQPDDDDIHAARKSCKKLRAWLRLLRPELGEHYAILNALLRDAGRALSARRDATVANQTLMRLRRGRRLSQAQFTELRDALHSLQRLEDPPATCRQQARRLLKAAQVYLLGTPLQTDSASVRAGLQRNRHRCVRGLRQVQRTRRAEDLHDWRKRVKYYGYQCGLLAPLFPDAASDAAALKALGETLGLHHDFHAFAQRLEHCPAERLSELQRLRARQLAQARMDGLCERALRQAKWLFGVPSP